MKQKTDHAAAETAQTTDSPAVVHEHLVRLLGFFGIRETSGMVKPSVPTPPPPPRKAPELPKWAEEWNALVAKMPVGTVIEYLGLKLMVVGIGEAYLMYWGGSCGFWTAKKLRCEYVDARGIIRTKEFTVNEALHCLPNVKVWHGGESGCQSAAKERRCPPVALDRLVRLLAVAQPVMEAWAKSHELDEWHCRCEDIIGTAYPRNLCPVCCVESSINWRDGKPYYYCPDHGELDDLYSQPNVKEHPPPP
jgi:hypothetical protein